MGRAYMDEEGKPHLKRSWLRVRAMHTHTHRVTLSTKHQVEEMPINQLGKAQRELT